jgi:hypothetical protein
MLLALSLAACGGGEHNGVPQKPIPRHDLAAMVPRTADLPSEVRNISSLDSDASREYVTNANASRETPDPADSGPVLARLGRTDGYRYLFSTISNFGGLAIAEASVDAFRSTDEAQGFISKAFSDLRAQEGNKDPTLSGKISFVAAEVVPPALRPAEGAQYTLVFGDGEQLHFALIGFRVGRIVGWSRVARADDVDPRLLAERIAEILRARIQGVLA